jgi:hypothetical protein
MLCIGCELHISIKESKYMAAFVFLRAEMMVSCASGDFRSYDLMIRKHGNTTDDQWISSTTFAQ